MKKKNYILRGAGVLLIGALLICSSVATIATTKDKNDFTNINNHIETNIKNFVANPLSDNPILWDNFVNYLTVAYHAQDDPPETPVQWDSFPADDFTFDEETEVHWIYWQLVYWNCNAAGGPKDYHYDWNVTFFEDDGSGYRPGNIFAGPFTLNDGDIDKSKPYTNSTTYGGGMWNCGAISYLPSSVTFDADKKYWISIYSTGPHFPQTGWYGHNESFGGIRLHEGVHKSEHWGHPDWTNISELWGEPIDMNFILGGDDPVELTISKGLGLTATITNRLHEPYNLTNVTVDFSITGGFVLSRTKTVEIGDIDPEATATAKFMPIGFGRIAVEVYAIEDGGTSVRNETNALLILIFTI